MLRAGALCPQRGREWSFRHFCFVYHHLQSDGQLSSSWEMEGFVVFAQGQSYVNNPTTGGQSSRAKHLFLQLPHDTRLDQPGAGWVAWGTCLVPSQASQKNLLSVCVSG